VTVGGGLRDAALWVWPGSVQGDSLRRATPTPPQTTQGGAPVSICHRLGGRRGGPAQ